MTVDTSTFVPMTEANQNFFKATRLVDEKGLAVILKNGKPRYVVVDFEEYDALQAARKQTVEALADQLVTENTEALRELVRW